MAAIRYTSIINAYVSTEGSNGIMTNYIYYSLLVTYENGSREIVEGKANHIAHLLSYLRTPEDELQELNRTLHSLRAEMNEIADQKMNYVVDTLFPIPDIQGMNELDAIARLQEAGLSPVLLNAYPETAPRNGIVRSYSRNKAVFKQVDLDIIHVLPDVEGRPEADARACLQAAGFHVQTSYIVRSDRENGIVLSCSRESETCLDVQMSVCVCIPETTGMTLDEALAALHAIGFEAEVKKTPVLSCTEPRVIKWNSKNDKTVRLMVNIPLETVCRQVKVEWENLPDSSGDSYTASAVFENRRNVLIITLNATAGSRTKYKLNAIDSKPPLQFEAPHLVYPYPTLSSAPSEFKIEVPANKEMVYGDNEVQLPQELSVTLEYQYGLMKKANVALNFSFDW